MISKSFILDKVENRQTIRGIELYNLSFKDIKIVSNIILEHCRESVQIKEYDLYFQSWNKKNQPNLKKENYIKKLENIKNKLIVRMDGFHNIDIKISLTRNPCYVVYKGRRYKSLLDKIYMPHIIRYNNSKYYYNTFFHEIFHSACSERRLKIKSDESTEEIIVEICSLILCFLSGYNVWDNSLSYINVWAYGKASEGEENVLYIKSKRQWKSIENKINQILSFSLNK